MQSIYRVQRDEINRLHSFINAMCLDVACAALANDRKVLDMKRAELCKAAEALAQLALQALEEKQ